MSRAMTVLALALAIFGAGWWQGAGSERERWQARVAAVLEQRAAAVARAEALVEALDREHAARAELARQLEEAADADHDADRIALPARSLRRIGAR